jgi:polygalacturonase
VVGAGTLDGRGGEPMLGSSLTWWDVAQDAKVKDIKHSNPRIVDVRKAKDFTLYGVTLQNSPKFHVNINSEGFVVWGVKVLTPARAKNSQGRALTPFYARNTDGIDPSSASNGVIAYCDISVGDDQIAIKGGSAGPIKNLVIAHNRFGSGHGMSIGSETNGGVSEVKVYDLSIDGDIDSGGAPDVDLNGIRLKSDASRGGLVENVSYTDVCIRDVPNAIILTPHYSKAAGTKIPVYRNIALNDVFAVHGSRPEIVQRVTLLGWDAEHLLGVALNGVQVEGVKPEHVKAAFADVKLGPGPVNFIPEGEKVTLQNQQQPTPRPNRCAEKFARKVR